MGKIQFGLFLVEGGGQMEADGVVLAVIPRMRRRARAVRKHLPSLLSLSAEIEFTWRDPPKVQAVYHLWMAS